MFWWIPWVFALGSVSDGASTEDRLSAFLRAVVDSTDFAGAVVVARDGEVVFEGGWGMANREAGVEFRPDTPVDAASLAKTFVAAGLWQLVEEGRLSPDDPVAVHVPEFAQPATVLQMLRHSAGVLELEDSTEMTNAEIARAVGTQPEFEPGLRFQYCNECFDILALVTERVTGRPWAEYLQENFFEPLGMSTAFLRPIHFADWPGVRTRSYRSEGDDVFDHDVFDGERFYGSSNVYLSARDLAAWGHGWVGGALIAPDTQERASRTARFGSGELSAMNDLNWFQATPGGPVYFDGHLRGFHSVLYWDARTKLVVAWVSNTLGHRPHELLFTRELVRIASGGAPSGVPRFPGAHVGDALDMNAIPGSYEVEGLGRVAVATEGGIVWISIEGGPEHVGYPSHGFYLPDLGVEVGFDELRDGEYGRLHWVTVFGVRTGRRALR